MTMRLLRRAARLAAVLPLAALVLAGHVAQAAEQPVTLDGGVGRLRGTLLLPDVVAPSDGGVPAVLFISGATDREGNGPSLRTDSLKQLAQSLGLKGIASLRVDKRGMAASKAALAREEDLSLDTYVQDAGRWLDLLRAQTGIGPIYLLGYNEGGLIATLLAQKAPATGLILLAAPGRPFGDLLRQQLPKSDLPLDVQQAAFNALAQLEKGQTVGDVPKELSSLFRPSLQPYLISELRHDPAAELAQTTQPALVIQGTNDLQVDMADAVRLSQARQGVRLVRLDGMNHVLKTTPANDRAANLASYVDSGQAINPGIVNAIVVLIRTGQ
ncbi:MAG: alpha/beta fold hydrolase [Azospirillaceae bacterium]|nr:alpha/beta fold hydrolase [Azospirillaceae bacterium]